jgi:ribosomal protein S18 acetylase RimI-like enzyme
MASRRVRMLQREDFPTLMDLETRVFGTAGEAVLGPFYVRLFCEFFAETSFLAVEDGKPVGYILCVLRGKEAYCTTLAVVPEHQGSRVAFDLLRRLIEVLAGRVDSCWFTVKENNLRARALHATLGARPIEVREDFYGPGDRRILSRIDRDGFEKMRARLERLRFIRGEPAESAA